MWVALWGWLACAAQDELEVGVLELLERLAPEGPGARVIELGRTEAGRAAIREAIAAAGGWKARRIDADPQTYYEGEIFTADAQGFLALKPERAAELQILAARVRAAREFHALVGVRLDQIARSPDGQGELDRRIVEFLKDPRGRLGVTIQLTDELGVPLESQFFDGFVRGDDGMLRLADEARESVGGLVEGIAGQRERAGEQGAAWEAFLRERKADEGAAALAGEFARRVLTARLTRYLTEGSENAMESLEWDTEGDLRVLVADVGAVRETLEAIGPRIKALAEGLATDEELLSKLKEQLADEQARVMLAERILTARRGYNEYGDDVLGGIRGMLYENNGERLAGFVEVGGPLLDEHAMFEDIAERCTDAKLADCFGAAEATRLLAAHRDATLAPLREAALRGALEVFGRRTLVEKDGKLHWRAERAWKVERIARRAAEIDREMKAAQAQQEP
jgi:hypothetical protein